MKALLIIFSALLFTGCTISQNVTPVETGTSIEKIYVKNNQQVHMKELVNEVVTQVKDLGFESESYDGERPTGALHYITYTGNWQWDVAMYLTYFQAKLYEDGKVLGEVEYDARSGGGNMGKFGRTAEKIRPLLTELLQNVKNPAQAK